MEGKEVRMNVDGRSVTNSQGDVYYYHGKGRGKKEFSLEPDNSKKIPIDRLVYEDTKSGKIFSKKVSIEEIEKKNSVSSAAVSDETSLNGPRNAKIPTTEVEQYDETDEERKDKAADFDYPDGDNFGACK